MPDMNASFYFSSALNGNTYGFKPSFQIIIAAIDLHVSEIHMGVIVTVTKNVVTLYLICSIFQTLALMTLTVTKNVSFLKGQYQVLFVMPHRVVDYDV